MKPRPGFTVVELLTVVGIIALLMGLLLPALSAVKKRTRKANETSSLRQVGMAWTAYANSNNDAILPGYLSTEAQQDWVVSYRFADNSVVPPSPEFPDGIEHNFAGPWTWRLMSYLDYNAEIVLGHLGLDDLDATDMKDLAWDIRDRPAFGYNGLHLGGWWVDGRNTFYDTTVIHDTEERVQVVSRSIGNLRRSSSMITFTAAAARTPGVYKYNPARDDDDGSWLITPPNVLFYDVWGETLIREAEVPDASGSDMTARIGGDPYSIEYYGNANFEPGSEPVPDG